MKCRNCPAYSKKDGFTGCLALQHKIHSCYDGCNRSYSKVKHELWDWLYKTDSSQLNKFNFWHVCKNPLNSHWVSVYDLKDDLYYG